MQCHALAGANPGQGLPAAAACDPWLRRLNGRCKEHPGAFLGLSWPKPQTRIGVKQYQKNHPTSTRGFLAESLHWLNRQLDI